MAEETTRAHVYFSQHYGTSFWRCQQDRLWPLRNSTYGGNPRSLAAWLLKVLVTLLFERSPLPHIVRGFLHIALLNQKILDPDPYYLQLQSRQEPKTAKHILHTRNMAAASTSQPRNLQTHAGTTVSTNSASPSPLMLWLWTMKTRWISSASCWRERHDRHDDSHEYIQVLVFVYR